MDDKRSILEGGTKNLPFGHVDAIEATDFKTDPVWDSPTQAEIEDLFEEYWESGDELDSSLPTSTKSWDFPFQPNHKILHNIKRLTSPLGNSAEKQESSFPSNNSFDVKLFDYTIFSSYFKIIRIIAYLLRILPKHAHSRSSDSSICRPDDLQVAEGKVQFLVKSELFPFEKNKCWKKSTLPEKAPFRSIPLSLVPTL